MRQRTGLGVFGGDLEVAADVMGDQFLDLFRRAHGEVVTHAGTDQDALDSPDRPRLAIQLDQRAMVGSEISADVGEHAGQAAAGSLRFHMLASFQRHHNKLQVV